MKKLFVALAMITSASVTPMALTFPVHAAASTSDLGDLSPFQTIASDTLDLVKNRQFKAAEARITDFETAWDKAEPTLYPKNHEQWGKLDEAADAAITSLRTHPHVPSDVETALTGLIAALKNPAGQ